MVTARGMSPRRSVTGVLAHGLLAAGGLLAVSVDQAFACSSASSALIYTPNASTIYVLGTAHADSLRTGAGSVVLERDPPATDLAARQRNVHGQLVDVERVTGPARALLPRGATRVVFVPWGYSADCRPMLRRASAVWELPGTRGVYFGSLRARKDWAGGVPTVDVFITEWRRPYVRGVAPYMAPRRFDLSAMMSEEDVLDLMERVPPDSALRRDTAASAALFAWAREHPSLVPLYPARPLLQMVSYQQRRDALQTVRHPATGTYRLTLRVNDGQPYTLFARTTVAPAGGFMLRGPQTPDDPLTPMPYEAWSFQTFVASTEAGLPSDCRGQYNGQFAYLSLRASAPLPVAGGLRATGAFELKAFPWIFRGDTVVANAARASFQDYMARSARTEPMAMGTIDIDPTGGARVMHAETLGGGRHAVVTGERISVAAIMCEPA